MIIKEFIYLVKPSSSSSSEEETVPLSGKHWRTRGGKTNNSTRKDVLTDKKKHKELDLEMQWEMIDKPPNVPKFTSECTINVPLPDEPTAKCSIAKDCKNVSVNEMKTFLGLYLLTGVVHKPEINQHWT